MNYHFIKARTKTEIILTDGKRLPISKEIGNHFGEQYGKLLRDEIEF